MSRFHRDTFHPPSADLKPRSPERVRKRRGKRSGHAAPPWSCQAEPVAGLESEQAPATRLQKAVRALLAAANRASAGAARGRGRRGGGG